MGLSKLSGDPYDFYEDSKLAGAGVASNDENQVAKDPIPEQQLPPVNASLGQPAADVPVEAPMPTQNIYSQNQSSLPPPTRSSNSTKVSSSMSRLKDLLYKSAMTEDDLNSSYADMDYDPGAYQGTLGTTEAMENFSPPSDYSNYLAAKAPVAQESYDIGEQDMASLYGDIPENAVYLGGGTLDEDVAPGVYTQEIPYETMGYDPYQAYSNYEQMYATPGDAAGEYQDVQTQALDPEQQAYSDQKAVYDESYNEVYQYLLQMGYSPEEASAAVPSLLGQVSVAAPQAPEQSKTASYMFKQAAQDLVSEYIDAGYSPFQAREMSITVVVPYAEKYASQGRVIGGAIGALAGGAGGHAMYDDDGEISGALISAAIGGGLGAMAPGRLSQYSGKRLLASGKNKAVRDAQTNIIKEQKALMEQANAEQLRLINAQLTARGVPLPATTLDDAKILATQAGIDLNALTGLKTQQKLYGKAKKLKELADKTPTDVKALQELAATEAAAVRSGDLTKALGVAVPGALLHRYAASHGGDNLVDNAFEGANYLGDRAIDAASLVADNPEYLALAAGGYGAIQGGKALSEHMKKRRASGPKKKGRTKKAQLEAHAAELAAIEKIASLLARAGGGLLGGVVGAEVGGAATDDHYLGQSTGAVLGALAGAGIPFTAYKGLGHAIKKPVANAGQMGAANRYLGQTAASVGIGATSGMAGEVERERQRYLEAVRQGKDTETEFLRAATRGASIGGLLGGIARMNPWGARGVAGAALAYPGYMIGKSALKRTARAMPDDLNPLSEESMRAFGQGFGDVANIGRSGAQAVGLTAEQAKEKGNSLVNWAKENPYLAGAAALGTAGAAYGGYRMLSNNEPSAQEKLEAMAKKRKV